MEDEQDQEAAVRSDYDAVCCKLNLDRESMDAAWESYIAIKDFYTLEVSATDGRALAHSAQPLLRCMYSLRTKLLSVKFYL